MWVAVDLPYIFERMIAFSIPCDNEMWVMSYEGLHRITLAPTISVLTDRNHAEDYRLYDAKQRMLKYGGRQFPMLGLHGGEPILRDACGNRLELALEDEKVTVVDSHGDMQEITFSDRSGDWGAATFSAEGQFLVIGLPYDLYVFKQATHLTIGTE